MSARPEALALSSLALFALAPVFAPSSLIVFTWAGPVARASVPAGAFPPPVGSAKQGPLLGGSPYFRLSEPRKGRLRNKVSLVPLIKKKIAELMAVLGRTFNPKKDYFQVPQKLYMQITVESFLAAP